MSQSSRILLAGALGLSLIAGVSVGAPAKKPALAATEADRHKQTIRTLRAHAARGGPAGFWAALNADLRRHPDIDNFKLESFLDGIVSDLKAEADRRRVAKTPEEIYRTRSSTAVSVRCEAGAAASDGTGVSIAPDRVATTFHQIRGASAVEIRTSDGEVIPVASVRWFDVLADLAVIELERPRKQGGDGIFIRNVEERPIAIGERVCVIGNPRGLSGTFSTGEISGARGSGPRVLYQITAPISLGSSGSPVFDRRGDVIGLVKGTLPDSQNINFCSPAGYIQLPSESLLATIALAHWKSYSLTLKDTP